MKKPNVRYALAEITKSEERGDGELFIEGVASTGSVDRQGEIVDQPSLKKAVADFAPKHLYHQHNWNAPIGRLVSMISDGKKLLTRAEIGKGYEIPILGPLGDIVLTSMDNIRAQIKQGLLSTLSIGFVGDKHYELDDEGFPDTSKPATLIVRELLEISAVTIPANRECVFSVAKSYNFDEMAGIFVPGPFEDNASEGVEDEEAVKEGLKECLRKLSNW